MLSQQLSLDLVKESIKNKNYRKALAQLSQLSIQHSHDEDFLVYLSDVQNKLSDFSGLLKTYQTLEKINLSSNKRAYYQCCIIEILYKLNKKNEALDVIYDFMSKTSERLLKVKVLLILTKIYIEENDFEGVEEALDELSLLKCENEFTVWASGLVELHQKKSDLALGYFRKSIKMNPNQDYAWVSLSMLHYEMGDLDLAHANLEKALDLNPVNAVALKLYAIWNSKNSLKQQKALGRLRFYLSHQSFDEDMSLCFIKMLCHAKMWSEANFELDKLIINNPKNQSYLQLKKSLRNLEISC